MRTGPPALDPGKDLPAAPRQARSIEKRRRFLEATRDVFGEKGYAAASIEEIATQAGAAAGAFYLHFASKRQLLVILMSEFLWRLDALDLKPRPAAEGRTGLRRFLTAAFRSNTEYYGVVRAWQEAVRGDRQLARMQTAIESWTQSRILGVFQALQQSPLSRPDVDLPAFARMMDRHFWSLLARGSVLSTREFNREIAISADVIYYTLVRDW